MAKLHTFPKLSVIAALLTSIVGCGSDSESADLVKAVTLEKLRTEGTIIESVTIENDQTRLRAGEKHQLSATGIDSNGETRNVTNELTWSSSNTDIATVSNSGLVTAVANLSANQGIITIKGTTINDISGDGEMSISDEAVTSIQLKQASPETGNINTCISASINGDVTYADGYTSLNTVKDMSFELDDTTTASIASDGTLYTSSSEIETTSITANIGDVTDQLVVTADPINLESIDVLVNGDSKDIITLNVGSRLQVNAQASLVNDESTFDINPTISWSVSDTTHVGITTEDSENVTLFALKPGVTQLIGSCGGKQQAVAVEVTGSATLDSVQINDGESPLTLTPLQTIDLTLTANYSTSPSSLNVTEFTDWSLNGSDVVNAEIIDAGTNQAVYRITSNSNTNGTVIVSATYDEVITNIQINIE